MAKPETGKPITAGSAYGKALLALRPDPGMTSAEASERWQTYGTNYFTELRRLGLVAYDGETWTLTAAGRAACPYRNPLLAAAPEGSAELPANVPEKSTMQGKTTVSNTDMLAAIKAAGPAGTTAKALIKRFGCSETIVYNHIMRFSRAQEPVIFKPRYGIVAAIEYQPAPKPAPASAALPAVGAVLPSVDIEGVSLAVDHHEVGELPAASHAAQMALIAEPPRYAVAFNSDFYPSVEAAIASAAKNYEGEDLKAAIIVACTPLGRIEVRPVFVPAEAV